MILNDGVSQFVLPNALEWVDEFDWSSIGQDVKPLIGGGMVVSESPILSGRPFTLVGGQNVWVDKSLISALYDSINSPDVVYTLTLADSRQFTVRFNRGGGLPLEAKPIWRKNIQESTDKYTLTLRLMEV